MYRIKRRSYTYDNDICYWLYHGGHHSFSIWDDNKGITKLLFLKGIKLEDGVIIEIPEDLYKLIMKHVK